MTHKIKTLLLFSACATAMSMFTAAADTCANAFTTYGDTLQDLITNNVSCTYGGFTFSNFSYIGSPLTASQVTVGTLTNAYGAGLEFNGSWNAFGNNSTSDGDIGFTVTSLGGATVIEDAGLAVTSGVGGAGIATVSEDGCSGTNCVPGTWAVETFHSTGTTSDSADYIFNAPTGSVTVSKDINAAANGVDPTNYATISLVADTFSAVPEPRALSLLLGFGILGGLVLRKKFQSVKA